MPTVAAAVMAATQQQKRGNKKRRVRGSATAVAAEPEEPSEPAEPVHWLRRAGIGLLDFLNSLALQTCLYLAFVFIFQNLANTMRLKEEVSTLLDDRRHPSRPQREPCWSRCWSHCWSRCWSRCLCGSDGRSG